MNGDRGLLPTCRVSGSTPSFWNSLLRASGFSLNVSDNTKVLAPERRRDGKFKSSVSVGVDSGRHVGPRRPRLLEHRARKCILGVYSSVVSYGRSERETWHNAKTESVENSTKSSDDEKDHREATLQSRAAAPAWGCEARLELDAAGSVNRLKASRVGPPPPI